MFRGPGNTLYSTIMRDYLCFEGPYPMPSLLGRQQLTFEDTFFREKKDFLTSPSSSASSMSFPLATTRLEAKSRILLRPKRFIFSELNRNQSRMKPSTTLS